MSIPASQASKLYTSIGTPGAFSGYSGFIKNANLPDSDDIRRLLSRLDSYTLHKPVRKKFQRRRIRVNFLDYCWGLDLIDMKSLMRSNSHYAWILVAQDIFSRFVFLRPLKTKQGVNVVEALKDIFKEHSRKPSRYFWTDQGKEFLNQHMKEFCKTNNIHLYHTFSKNKVAPVENVIRTIKQKIYRYLTHDTSRWVHILSDVQSQLNNTYHRALLTTPQDVTQENEGEIWLNLHFNLIGKTPPKPKFVVGDTVLISKSRLIFDKGFTVGWHKELFRVNKVNVFPEVITYKLEDTSVPPVPLQGEFYTEDLQLIPANQNGRES